MTDALKKEAAGKMTTEKALAMLSKDNSWLKSRLLKRIEEEKECECGACYLCAYSHLEGLESRATQAERDKLEQLKQEEDCPWCKQHKSLFTHRNGLCKETAGDMYQAGLKKAAEIVKSKRALWLDVVAAIEREAGEGV